MLVTGFRSETKNTVIFHSRARSVLTRVTPLAPIRAAIFFFPPYYIFLRRLPYIRRNPLQIDDPVLRATDLNQHVRSPVCPFQSFTLVKVKPSLLGNYHRLTDRDC